MKGIKRIGRYRTQILCIGASVLLAIGYMLGPGQDTVLKEGHIIERGAYGSGSSEYSLLVEGLGEEAEDISFSIAERTYSDKEIEERFDELATRLPEVFCPEGQSVDAISSDLYLPSRIDGYEGIRISWYPEDTDLMDYEGRLRYRGEDGERTTGISAVLTYNDWSAEYFYELTIVPPELTEEERNRLELVRLIEEADMEDPLSEAVELPTTVNGREVSYASETDTAPLLIIFLGLLSAVLISVKPMEDKRKSAKQREERLSREYADIVSKLLLYIGAGLTARNAWARIYTDHEEMNRGEKEGSPVMEEIRNMLRAMDGGMPEGRAYTEFGRSCGLRCYQRLASVLEQNRKNGSRDLRNLLRIEMEEAFEQRKNQALREGQQASTKLMLPLFISFGAVMLIIMAPALMSMG